MSDDANRPKIIMFDGPDGVGKTTQLALTAEALTAAGYKVATSRILGGTPFGEKLREVLFSDLPRPAHTNLYVTLAIYTALADSLRQYDASTIVLIDRSPLSIIAYEAYGDGTDLALATQACTDMLELFKPTGIVLYKATPEQMKIRRSQRHSHENDDYFENQPADYFQRVAKGYQESLKLYSAQVLDARGSIERMQAVTLNAVYRMLEV